MKPYFALFALLAACSSDPLEPGAGNDPGAGSKTLSVDGNATATPRMSNARLATDFTTEFSVRISLNGAQVTTGSVSVTSQYATTNLTYSPDNNGRWIGTAANYDEVYRLDVTSGADEVHGVTVDGPSIHVITAPTAGASLDSTAMNPVMWDRDEAADIATIDTETLDRLTIPDNGAYMMGAGSLKAEKDKAKENRIEIRRTNHVSPAGAVAGSDFAVSIENRVDVLALPNPAL
jgi:hypothetical protein